MELLAGTPTTYCRKRQALIRSPAGSQRRAGNSSASKENCSKCLKTISERAESRLQEEKPQSTSPNKTGTSGEDGLIAESSRYSDRPAGVSCNETYGTRSRTLNVPSIPNVSTIRFLLLLFLASGTLASWWSPNSNTSLVSVNRVCLWARRIGGAPSALCRREQKTITKIQQGIERAINSCSREFRGDRWNCSQHPKVYYEKLMAQGQRESAFVQALTAAAITYEVTYACTSGHLDCGCIEKTMIQRKMLLQMEAKRHKVTVTREKLMEAMKRFNWGGCNDDVNFGSSKTRQFLDQERLAARSDVKSAVTHHNYEAGRLAIANHMRSACRCHGFSASCTMRTCWDKMEPFQEVRRRIASRFESAVRVSSNYNGSTLVRLRSRRRRRPRRSAPEENALPRKKVARKSQKSRLAQRRIRMNRILRFRRRRRGSLARRISKEDLVYFRQSPSFCNRSKKRGSVGTQGRQCNPATSGLGSCSYLCCGRGHRKQVHTITKKSNCKFVYCCQVVCEEKQEEVVKHYCN